MVQVLPLESESQLKEFYGAQRQLGPSFDGRSQGDLRFNLDAGVAHVGHCTNYIGIVRLPLGNRAVSKFGAELHPPTEDAQGGYCTNSWKAGRTPQSGERSIRSLRRSVR